MTYGYAACSPGFYGPILHKLASRWALKAFPSPDSQTKRSRRGMDEWRDAVKEEKEVEREGEREGENEAGEKGRVREYHEQGRAVVSQDPEPPSSLC